MASSHPQSTIAVQLRFQQVIVPMPNEEPKKPHKETIEILRQSQSLSRNE
jgi:hypothetical protein